MLLILALVGALLGILGLIAGFLALRTLGRMRRNLALLQRDGSRESFAQAVTRQIVAVDALRGQVGGLGDRVADLDAIRQRLGELEDRAERGPVTAPVTGSGRTTGGLHRVALVRYDAYPGMGGRMSWSVAMLDDHGSGLVLTGINSRSEARAYAKVMVDGTARQPLSGEEQRAVAQARGERRRPSRVSALKQSA